MRDAQAAAENVVPLLDVAQPQVTHERERRFRELLARCQRRSTPPTRPEGSPITTTPQRTVGPSPGARLQRMVRLLETVLAGRTPLPHDECPMAVALKENRAVRGMEAAAERPDGTRVPFIPYPTPIHDEAGKFVGAVNMLVDITERKRAEEQQALMVRELHHRVKHTLATVQAIMGSTAR